MGPPFTPNLIIPETLSNIFPCLNINKSFKISTSFSKCIFVVQFNFHFNDPKIWNPELLLPWLLHLIWSTHFPLDISNFTNKYSQLNQWNRILPQIFHAYLHKFHFNFKQMQLFSCSTSRANFCSLFYQFSDQITMYKL